MQKKWIEKTIAEWTEEREKLKKEIKKRIDENEFMTDKEKEEFYDALDEIEKTGRYPSRYIMRLGHCYFERATKGGSFDITIHEKQMAWVDWLSVTIDKMLRLNGDWLYEDVLDSEAIEFDGDIIITDPCYVIRAPYRGTKPLTEDDWETCEYGKEMYALGINTYMTRGTIYGDWSCTTFDKKTKEPIGRFCADTGLVSVFLLDEVLKYNPDFDYHIKKLWTTTWIKDFKGKVRFRVIKTGKNPHDPWSYSVRVVGKGINKKTGEPIEFETRQTGL